MAAEPNLMDRLTALCKRRGFIFPGSEIYGGLGGFWDYGPLGVELKRNVKDLWWRDMVLNPPTGPDGKEVSMVGIDAALIRGDGRARARDHRQARVERIRAVGYIPGRWLDRLLSASGPNRMRL